MHFQTRPVVRNIPNAMAGAQWLSDRVLDSNLLMANEPRHEISNNVNNVICATSKASDQSDQSLCLSLVYSMRVKLLPGHHLEFLSLKGGCTGSSESTIVKMPHCFQ